MSKYPSNFRASRLKHLLQPLRVESNHHLLANDNCRSRAALVRLDQFSHGREISRNVADLKVNSSLREEGLSNAAGRSAWLTEYDDFMLLHITIGFVLDGRCLRKS